MNESQRGSWYFSRDGERIGPVGFADLQLKAKEGGLNPRLDVVWKEGMTDWKPAGEIDGLFERPPTPESFGTIGQPGQTGQGDLSSQVPLSSVREQMRNVIDWPGARRRSLIFVTFLFPILWALLISRGEPFIAKEFGKAIAAKIILGAQILPLVMWAYFSIQRLRNVGMSGWWFLGYLVPFLNLWIAYRSYVCPPGYAFHRKLDAIGILFAILFWLIVLAGLVALAATIALQFGKIADPAIRQQLQELLDKGRQLIPKK
jgi:uncharacterized membrane protein YhaH (DUF805 family)